MAPSLSSARYRSVSVHHCRLFRLFICIVHCLHFSSALFLRPSRDLTKSFKFESDQSLSDRSNTSVLNDLTNRERRSIPDWQNEIRQKAERFGQVFFNY